jgi:hypothetical protein
MNLLVPQVKRFIRGRHFRCSDKDKAGGLVVVEEK